MYDMQNNDAKKRSTQRNKSHSGTQHSGTQSTTVHDAERASYCLAPPSAGLMTTKRDFKWCYNENRRTTKYKLETIKKKALSNKKQAESDQKMHLPD